MRRLSRGTLKPASLSDRQRAILEWLAVGHRIIVREITALGSGRAAFRFQHSHSGDAGEEYGETVSEKVLERLEDRHLIRLHFAHGVMQYILTSAGYRALGPLVPAA